MLSTLKLNNLGLFFVAEGIVEISTNFGCLSWQILSWLKIKLLYKHLAKKQKEQVNPKCIKLSKNKFH